MRGGSALDTRRTSWRLGIQTALLVIGCLVIVSALVVLIVARAQTEASRGLLAAATSRIDAVGEAPAGVRVVVATPQGRSESPGMPPGLPDEAALVAVAQDGVLRQGDVSRGGVSYTIRTEKVGDRVTQAILDQHESREELSRIIWALLIAGGVGVLLSGLLAAWLARRAVLPMAQALALQRRFVADASHELRTPLTLLSTRAQLLGRRLAKGPQKRDATNNRPDILDEIAGDVNGIIGDTHALGEILEDLLIAADTRETFERGSVDVARMADECVTAAAAAADQSHVQLVRTGDLQARIADGVAVSLRRAITALIDNALDHANSHVGVCVTLRANEVVVEVVDDGPGVSEEAAPRLFERFATSRGAGGGVRPGSSRHYGLGLALVAEVAALHGGSVFARARADGITGANLTLRLPVTIQRRHR